MEALSQTFTVFPSGRLSTSAGILAARLKRRKESGTQSAKKGREDEEKRTIRIDLLVPVLELLSVCQVDIEGGIVDAVRFFKRLDSKLSSISK
jgi:hypothetical protein